jgi:hypothetical protein
MVGVQPVKKFSDFYRIWRFIAVFKRPLDYIISHLKTASTITLKFFKIRVSFIIPSKKYMGLFSAGRSKM